MLIFVRCKKLFCSFIIYFSILLSMVLIAISLDKFYPDLLSHLASIMTQHKIIFTCFRLILLVILFLAWPIFIRCAGNQQIWTKERTHFWIHRRWTIFSWLILFELLVNENVLFHLLNWIH